MNTDEFEIIIERDGTIYVKFEGMEEKQVRKYQEIIEEAIGPIREVIKLTDEGTPPGGVRFIARDQKEIEQGQGS